MNKLMRNSITYGLIGFMAISACASKKKANNCKEPATTKTEQPSSTNIETPEKNIGKISNPIKIDKDRTACEQPWGTDEVENTNRQKFGYFQSNYQTKDYAEAYKNWKHLATNVPCSHFNIYAIGEVVLTDLITKEKDSLKKRAFVEDLNTNFKQRIQYFGDENKQRERWAKSLYTLAPYEYEIINDNLERTIDRDGDSTDSDIMIYYLNNAFRAFNAKKLSNDQMFENYNKLSDIVENNIEVNESDSAELSRWLGLQMSLDQIISNVGTCEDLLAQFKPYLATNKTDKEWLNKAEKALRAKKCTGDPIYIEILEYLYKLDPTLDVAKRLSSYYYGSGKNTTLGNKYMEEVIARDKGNNAKNSDRYATMASKAQKAGNTSAARNYADKALALNPNNGYALLIKGSALYKIARGCSETAFDKKASAWIMMEYALKAKSSDSRVSRQASNTYARYSAYGPGDEDKFMNGRLEPGDRYTIKCAGITTTAR